MLSLAPGGRLRPEHLPGGSHHQNLGHHPVFDLDSLTIHQVQQGLPTRLQIGDRPMTEQSAVWGVTSTMHPWNSDLSCSQPFQPFEATADELDNLLRQGGPHDKVIWMGPGRTAEENHLSVESKRRFVDALMFHPSNILNGCQPGKRPCFVSAKTTGYHTMRGHGPRTIWCQELMC